MKSRVRSPLGPLPDGWSLVRLRDITSKIGSGATPKGGESVYLSSRVNCSLVRSQNVYDRWFDSSSLAFISDEHAKELAGVELRTGDLLLNITGDGVTFSRSCMVPDEVLPARVNQHVSIVRARPDLCLPGYLLSYLTHPTVKEYIESFNSGGSRRAITKGHIESFLVPLPPLPEQGWIGQVLGALDGKVELGRQMNRTLEAMARTIFKSWFVDTEVRSREALVDLLVLHREILEPSASPGEWFDHYSIPAFDEDRSPVRELGSGIKSNKFLVPEGAILLSKLNPRIPRVWRPRLGKERRSISSTEFLVVTPRQQREDRDFLYSFFCSEEFMEIFASRATGTSGSHQRVRPEDLLVMRCPAPDPEVRRRYSEVVGPMFERFDANLEESRTLAALRDALLPKLLSGEIRVKQAEKLVGEVV